MKSHHYLSFLSLILITVFSVQNQAESIRESRSGLSSLNRCYAYLTGLRIPKNHSLISQVKSGTISGAEACRRLVDRGSLNSSGLISASVGTETESDARKMLHHMQAVNKEGFSSTNLCLSMRVGDVFCRATSDYMDSNLGAAVLTEALFNPSRNFSYILQFDRAPKAERELPAGVKYPQYSSTLFRETPYQNLYLSANKNPAILNDIVYVDVSLCANKATRSADIKSSPCIDTGASGIDANIVLSTDSTSSFGITDNLMAPSSYVLPSQRIMTGQLIGVRYDPSWQLRLPSEAAKDPYFRAPGTSVQIPAVDLRRTIEKSANSPSGTGSGLIGTYEYLLLNFGWDLGFKADGSIKMPRRWSKAVYKDLLCRDLPVVRESDAKPYLLNSSSGLTEEQLKSAAPFRMATSCVSCHASMDQMSGVLRQVTWREPHSGRARTADAQTSELVKWPSKTSSATDPWLNIPLATTDPVQFHERPPVGKFFMRSYDGRLYNQTVNDIADLSNFISQTDDFYVCQAKKYFKYLTGYDVSLHDIADPANSSLNKGMTARDWERRNYVIKIGLELKQHQKLSQTMKDLLSSDYFQKKEIEREQGTSP